MLTIKVVLVVVFSLLSVLSLAAAYRLSARRYPSPAALAALTGLCVCAFTILAVAVKAT